MARVDIYDTTLRDGTQYEGMSLSVEDKLAIAQKLDRLGVHYIEGGWPGSNPKDVEFFDRAQDLRFEHSTLTAFGSTRRAGLEVERDPQIQTLLDSNAPVLTLVGKTWDLHVTRVIETSLEENLSMIADSIAYLASQDRRVFFDAEHFFDGFKDNPEYALRCVATAAESGAECVVLCDTNGGTLPDQIGEIVATVRRETDSELGIHTHNDADAAVSGALVAVRAGVSHVQGTVNGYGERCGNANLLSLIANLKLKMGIECVSDEQLGLLSETSLFVAERANMQPQDSQPYVGASAFAHKGGIHVAAVSKVESSYQHIDPRSVGNDKRVLVSELSGRSNIAYKVEELDIGVELTKDQTRALLELVKNQESKGFQYEGAEASFELLVKRMLPGYEPPFELVEFMTVVEQGPRGQDAGDIASQVMLKVRVGDDVMHTAADGNGPVNALDNALRKALLQFYPSLEPVRLVDYKVRVVDQGHGTGAVVRVLIESTDGHRRWSTVGSSENIIEASLMALTDSLESWLLRHSAGVAG